MASVRTADGNNAAAARGDEALTLRAFASGIVEGRHFNLLAGTTAAALLSVAGSIALAPLVHWLLRAGHPRFAPLVHLPLLALFAGRSAFTMLHTRGICRLVDLVAAGRAAPVTGAFITKLVILTRDLPLLLFTLLAMVWLAHWAGFIADLLLCTGLLAALFVRPMAEGSFSSVTSRRLARSQREIASELPLALLILGLAAARALGMAASPAALASIVACALLLRGPQRRVARLLEHPRHSRPRSGPGGAPGPALP